MSNKRPDIEGEMDELQRAVQDLSRDENIEISVEQLVKAFNSSKEETLTNDIWGKLENTESNEIQKGDTNAVMKIAKMYNKTSPKILAKAIMKGEYNRPLILKLGDRYILVAGNTRLSTAAAIGVSPKVFIGEIGQEVDIKDLINKAHKDITRTKGKEYAPDHNEIQKWIDDKLEVSESEKLKGGKADNKSLVQIAKKHDAKSYYHIDDMVKSLKKQVEMGLPIEMDHTDSKDKALEIVYDHLFEDPKYYSKLKKADIDETDSGSSGSFEGPAFGGMVKRKINTIPNANLNENEEEIEEATDSSSSGAFDVPAFGKTTKGGRKDPLKIDGPNSIYKGRAVTDKKFPKWGGPGGVFVKIKEKCKKFPYCNQGNTGALEFIKEDKEIQNAINEVSKNTGIPKNEIQKIVLNEIKQIFI
jgi:hypothetical protein